MFTLAIYDQGDYYVRLMLAAGLLLLLPLLYHDVSFASM
jgi:hypothetical protein